MSVATALARARVRSTSTTSRATPRITSANAHAEPTLPAPMTPTFMTILLPCARRCPEVDPTFGGVPIDLFQLAGRKLDLFERADVLLQLNHAAGPNQRRRDARIAQGPSQRHLRQRLAAPAGDLMEGPHLRQDLFRQQIGRKRTRMAGSRAGRDASEISVGQQA